MISSSTGNSNSNSNSNSNGSTTLLQASTAGITTAVTGSTIQSAVATSTAAHDVQSYIAAIEQLLDLALQVQVAATITATTAQLAVPAMAQIAVACDIRNAIETIATQVC
jgi:hypothetical protein